MTQNKVYLNIACGESFVKDSVWLNMDYNHIDEDVKKCNLLGSLPFADQSVDVIYSSHFFEHIPRNSVLTFLSECNRILKQGGVLRLVMPDFLEMCTEYLNLRSHSDSSKAEFLMLEIIDQCVRMTPGGELAQFYRQLDLKDVPLNQYIKDRTGHAVSFNESPKKRKTVSEVVSAIYRRFEKAYCKFITSLLPKAFKDQNISFSDVGERHAWLYDFESVAILLKKSSFSDIAKMSASTSQIKDFNFFPLDLEADGSPRKGKESMYIESRKA